MKASFIICLPVVWLTSHCLGFMFFYELGMNSISKSTSVRQLLVILQHISIGLIRITGLVLTIYAHFNLAAACFSWGGGFLFESPDLLLCLLRTTFFCSYKCKTFWYVLASFSHLNAEFLPFYFLISSSGSVRLNRLCVTPIVKCYHKFQLH